MNAFRIPETTTMTPEEAEAVVRRHLAQTPEIPDGPTVADMAEALRLPPEEVARLLAEVRAVKPRRRTTRRERRVWLLSGLAAVLMGAVVVTTMRATHTGPFARHDAAVQTSGPVEPYAVFLDGAHYGDLDLPLDGGPPSSLLPSLAKGWLKDNAAILGTPQNLSYEAAQQGARLAKAGRWEEIQGVRMVEFELRKPNDQGWPMRWARALVPVYNGDDAPLAGAVLRERDRRLEAAIVKALEGVPPSAG